MFVSVGGSRLLGGGSYGVTIKPPATPVPASTPAPMQPLRPYPPSVPVTGGSLAIRPLTSVAQASVLPTTHPMDLTASGTAGGGGTSVAPNFNVSGGSSTGSTVPGTTSDYTWLLYVAGGLALAYITWRGMKKG